MRFAFAVVALVSACSSTPSRKPGSCDGPCPASPIDHVVIVIQENHTFDNYFGTYPGADGIPAGTCMPADPADPAGPDCVKPYRIGGQGIVDMGHTGDVFQGERNWRKDQQPVHRTAQKLAQGRVKLLC